MKFRINTSIEYKIFDKAVKAIITAQDVPKHIQQMYTCYYNLNNKNTPKTKLATTYTGVAVLKDGDKSDIELAKIIARKKAQRALYRNYASFTREVLARLSAIYRDWTEYSIDINEKALLANKYLQEK